MVKDTLGPAIAKAINRVARDLEALGGGEAILGRSRVAGVSDVEVTGFGTRATINPKVWIRDRVDIEFGARWPQIAQVPEYLDFERLWLERFGYRSPIPPQPGPLQVPSPSALPANVDPTAPSWIIREGIATKLLGGSVDEFVSRAVLMTDRAAANPLPQLVYEAPVQNFDAEGADRIDLTALVSLRRYTPYERAHLLGGINPTSLFGMTNLDVQFTTWALVTPAQAGRDWSDLQAAQDRFEAVLSALRLFQEPPIGLLGISQIWEPWRRLLMGGKNLYHQTQLLGADRPQAEYRLDTEGITRLRPFVDRVLSAVGENRTGPLPIAIRRFNDTYFHTRWVDRYVDAVIAMEALFLSGQKESQAFRFAACGSVLLGDTADEREDLFQRLRKAYANRSKILHGSNLDPGFEELRDVEGLTRRAILRTLELPEKERGARLAFALESRLVRGSGK